MPLNTPGNWMRVECIDDAIEISKSTVLDMFSRSPTYLKVYDDNNGYATNYMFDKYNSSTSQTA